MPDCNWCGGETIYDENGCFVRYVCANGADPCQTDPCFGPGDCGPNEVCQDMLCWPNGSMTCGPHECLTYTEPGGTSGCTCRWNCSDGHDYAFDCRVGPSGSISCECFVDGMSNMACASGGVPGAPPADPCSVSCCGFPQ